MIDRTHAGTLAQATLNKGDGITLGEVRELREGWFFPYRAEQLMSGSQGVIVNKRTGRIFNLGSAFPVERDLVLYDRGYQSSLYDLVILAVHDLSATAAGNGAPWLGLVLLLLLGSLGAGAAYWTWGRAQL